MMRSIFTIAGAGIALGLLAACPGAQAQAQAQIQVQDGATAKIVWEVKNRFRLFRDEKDFQRQVAAFRGDGVLAAEARLEQDNDGRGWAKDVVASLCVDAVGRLTESCVRDGKREIYLAPADHPVGAIVAGAPADAACAWRFEDGEREPLEVTQPCDKEAIVRARYGRPTVATVQITATDQPSQSATAEILVRDLLVAGLGDSIASGEGNPDQPVELSDEGFCFRRTFSNAGSQYFRPSRAGFAGSRACETGIEVGKDSAEWTRHGAGWLSPACHRSLYGYQMRASLELAVEYTHIAVTFIPLGCSGATIEHGMLGDQRADEVNCDDKSRRGLCATTVAGQIPALRDAIALAHRHQPDRNLDVVLLTVGANDAKFAELVANVIIDAGTERTLFEQAGRISSVADARQTLAADLPAAFAKLRAALKPLVGGDLSRVVYVSYGHPALQGGGTPCGGGRDGFDIHPAFAADGARLRETAEFVSDKLFPRLKALALCESGVLCQAPDTDRMAFVDAHQRAFAEHGYCVRSDNDPGFDRECFSPSGESFQRELTQAATGPLVCDRDASEFRPYASRARWIRTPNDSYFAAMTYPRGLPTLLQPSDIHDAIWGITSALFGGAIHPTAEGHAAMADAALPAMRQILGLDPPADVPEIRHTRADPEDLQAAAAAHR